MTVVHKPLYHVYEGHSYPPRDELLEHSPAHHYPPLEICHRQFPHRLYLLRGLPPLSAFPSSCPHSLPIADYSLPFVEQTSHLHKLRIWIGFLRHNILSSLTFSFDYPPDTLS